MAYFRIEYFSNALQRMTSFEMIIPNDLKENEHLPERPTRTLFLLHGYSGKAGNWVPEELTKKYNFAILMPTGENSFFLNGISTGHNFQTMLGEELVDYARMTFRLAVKPEETYIAGLSMGGFGAIHTGLAYPDRFGKIGALSSALIIHDIARLKPGDNHVLANYEYYRECFGDLEKVESGENNPEILVQKLKREKKKIPEIYMSCGTEDFLIENNRRFHQFLINEGIAHQYHEAPGIHDMKFWSEHIVKIVDWMMV